MAESPELNLHFRGNCPDCGVREVELPTPLADPGDDFDWRVRDYDDFRMFMLEELAARFPERRRWTPADMEVVIVEVLATVLDQLSDMSDRVASESYLETARRPETVRQFLTFIGYDAVAIAQANNEIGQNSQGSAAIAALESYWRSNPYAMEAARKAGPVQIHTQKRMVTNDDYALRLGEHPLVVYAHARKEWSGSWFTIYVVIIAVDNNLLDKPIDLYAELASSVIAFHKEAGASAPILDSQTKPTVRTILQPYIDAYRMAGQQVLLQDPIFVGIYMSISVRVSENFFNSEVRYAISQFLGLGPGGFFEPGRFAFGEDLYISDVIEVLMRIDGIEQVCLNRFKRIGAQYPDRVAAGYISLNGLEVAVCKNEAGNASQGYYQLTLHGGRRG